MTLPAGSRVDAEKRRSLQGLAQWATLASLQVGAASLALSSSAQAQSQASQSAGANVRSVPTDWFRLGVASGSPTATGVVLWTRLAPADKAELAVAQDKSAGIVVTWELADDERFSKSLRTGVALASADLDYSVHVDLQDLAPDRWYFYRFRVGNLSSAVGRTRTLPNAEALVRQFRMAYASCQNADQGHWAAWRHMQAENLDAVLFLGDYIYEYPMLGRFGHPRALHWAYDLDTYRERYTLYKSHADLKAMHAQVPWILTWDDHEVQNDYAADHSGFSGPPGVDFFARRTAAYQAYYENMPVPRSSLQRGVQGLLQGQGELRMYQRLAIGKLLSLVVLDGRQFKDEPPCTLLERRAKSRVTPDQCQAWPDTRRSMLGRVQEQWLDQVLGNANESGRGATWNVLAQGTLFGKRDNQAGPGESYFYEGWDAYDGARRRLVGSLMRHQVPNPVMLGGDVHEHWAGHILSDYSKPESRKVGVEFTTTSISSRGGNRADSAALLAKNPHFIHHAPDKRGYGVLQLTPKLLTADLKGLDDVTKPDSGIQSIAQFAVVPGRSALETVKA
jgi:alkaline phosphatase D